VVGTYLPIFITNIIDNTLFLIPVIIADISGVVSGDSNFVLQKSHLDFMINNYFGNVEQPCILVFKFGWSKYKNEAIKYFGIGNVTSTPLSFPGKFHIVSTTARKCLYCLLSV
jgi:hypothetical protein